MPPSKKCEVLVAQIGARRHYAVPRGLEAAGCLSRLVTGLTAHHPLIRAAGLVPKKLQPRGLNRLLDRIVPGVPTKKIKSSLLHELKSWKTRGGISETERYRNYVIRNVNFGNMIVKNGLGEANAVYGFNAASLEIFRYAKERGIRCVLDQTMAPFAYVEPMLADERAKWKGWDLSDVPADSWMPLAERESAEWNLADVIVCGSDFVMEKVGECGGPKERCRVVPYDLPSDGSVEKNIMPIVAGKHETFNVLFAGTVCLRKGIQYLCDALLQCKDLNLNARAVGSIELSELARSKLAKVIKLKGSCPRSEMKRHYEWADVLVLPSLAEGSANVTYEAIAAGVPVITTWESGSVVSENINGKIIPSGDSNALASCLREIFENHTDSDFENVSNMTPSRSDSRLPYGHRLAKYVCGISI